MVVLYKYPTRDDLPYSLGRHVEHTTAMRSLLRFKVPEHLVTTQNSVLWPDTAPVLDQTKTNSCTGNASAQLLNTEMFAPVRLAKHKEPFLTEQDAMEIYSVGTHLDGLGVGQDYPPHDEGGTGLGIAKAMEQLGYIDSYQFCFGMDEFLAAIQLQPIVVGTPWTFSLFTPDANGLATVGPLNAKTIAGGHEYLIRGVDFKHTLLTCRTSWGNSFGGGNGVAPGEFQLTFDDFETLLDNQGDAIVAHGVGLP